MASIAAAAPTARVATTDAFAISIPIACEICRRRRELEIKAKNDEVHLAALEKASIGDVYVAAGDKKVAWIVL